MDAADAHLDAADAHRTQPTSSRTVTEVSVGRASVRHACSGARRGALTCHPRSRSDVVTFVRFQCDSCGARYLVAELDSSKVADIGARGVRARCRRCGAWIVALPRLVLGRYRVVAKV